MNSKNFEINFIDELRELFPLTYFYIVQNTRIFPSIQVRLFSSTDRPLALASALKVGSFHG